MKLRISSLLWVGVVAILVIFAAGPLLGCGGGDGIRPIIFVHGSFGSGAQFESQAMRFTSNGYPANYIAVHEYDSTEARANYEAISKGTTSLEKCAALHERFEALDELIDALLEETGARQVDLLGHSLGTAEMINYLESSTERAEKVAHYVNIDGRTLDHLPGGVSTLALWAGIQTIGLDATVEREIVGAENIVIPNQTHVEVATSVEAFVEIYRFFTGEEPETTEIIFEEEIELAGRALFFPQNNPVFGVTMEIYRVDSDTGARINDQPEAVFELDDDGAWGPFEGEGGASYEFVILHRGGSEHHFYFEPFNRSNHLIRLLTSIPGGGVGALMDRGDNHSNLVIMRNQEFWGDQGDYNDILEINGENVVNEATCPVSNMTIAFFVYDQDADGQSKPEQAIAMFHAMPFFTGVDLYLPAGDPPDGTISLELRSRGSEQVRVVNVPNWSSDTNSITIQFSDFQQ